MNDIQRYALITGATSGFGYEFSKLLAADGYNLVMVARSADRLAEISEEIKAQYQVNVITLSQDLFRPDAAKEIFRETSARNINIDILINDAGQGEYGKFVDYDLSRDIDLIQLNITSLVSLTKLYLKDMLSRDTGKILQVASLLSKYPTPMMAVYAGTKAFVLSFTEALANELKDTNVTVTALLPGAADTDFFHKAGGENTVVYRETELSKPEDVARDGYAALMKGETKIVSGIKNKIQAAMSTMMPDSTLASTMRKQMSPSDKEDGRDRITHQPSQEERERIESSTSKTEGDYKDHKGHVHE